MEATLTRGIKYWLCLIFGARIGGRIPYLVVLLLHLGRGGGGGVVAAVATVADKNVTQISPPSFKGNSTSTRYLIC